MTAITIIALSGECVRSFTSAIRSGINRSNDQAKRLRLSRIIVWGTNRMNSRSIATVMNRPTIRFPEAIAATSV